MSPRCRFLGLALLVTGLLSPGLVIAQSPATPNPPQTPTQSPASLGAVTYDPAEASILRHRAWHEDFMPNQNAGNSGYRNPGNVGRYAEYYPPGNQFQNPQQAGSQHITAKIGLGGVPDRAEQIASYNAGTARYSAIQTHIDNYGRPMRGFGFGFGMGGFP